ncbi:hypothetical protein SSS_08255 [Sarcoptes scabiei]|nr:hypothetical protein SSS_08255 [Sarcoptes scabiei]
MGLPFSERIHWPSAVIIADERFVFQIPDQIRSISKFEIESMRLQGIYLYNNYFASVEKILLTTISIIEDRINIHHSREAFLTNVANISPLSSLWIDTRYSDLIDNFPRFVSMNHAGFTAIVSITKVIAPNQLIKFLDESLFPSKFIRKTLILWELAVPVFSEISNLLSLHPEKLIIESRLNSSDILNKFTCCHNHKSISTDAIFQIDPESDLITEEIDFAYLVWESFSERIVGFSVRDHYFDASKNQWTYSSKWTNQFSIVLFDAAIYHKYYNYLYLKHFFSKMNSTQLDQQCLGLAFNFFVSHILMESPIKVTQRKKTIQNESLFDSWIAWIDRKTCFQKLISSYGYIPLIKSKQRFEPLLYKDAVSFVRKKYRKLEMIS